MPAAALINVSTASHRRTLRRERTPPMAAQTYFCYGIPVTNESLTYATMAYVKLEGPFRFIRLVQKRIREGSLQTSQPSAVGALPIELWDLVRHKVTDVELCAAGRKFLNTHACEHCTPFGGCDCCCTRPAKRWTDLIRCEDCCDTITSYKGFGDPALTKVGFSSRRIFPRT